jgi:hypothetical protein
MNEMVYYDGIAQSLSRAAYHAHQDTKNTIGLLRMVLRDGMWRKRLVTVTGKVAEFDRFEDFVTALPPEGLGSSIEILKLVCASDPDLLTMIEQAINADKLVVQKLQPLPPIRETKGKLEIQSIPTPRISPPAQPIPSSYRRFSKDWTLDRLQKANRPDLAAKIKSGKMTPYRVQIELGWRKKPKKNRA